MFLAVKNFIETMYQRTSDVEQISMFDFYDPEDANATESMHKRQSTSFMRSSKVRQLNML